MSDIKEALEAMDNTILRMRKINKSFNNVQVLFDVDFDLKAGEIKGIIGENGAGKSTLMKILTGEYQKDSGEIELFGKIEEITTPRYALKLGIGMVYQELNNVPDMTISENMFIGREIRKYGLADKKEMNRKTIEYLQALNLSFSPTQKIGELTVSEMQMIEIAKVVSYGSKIVILDEPTSSITQEGIAKLFEVVRILQKLEIGIIYISHKLDELFELTNSIAIMRDGYMVCVDQTENLTQDELIRRMVGREVDDIFPDKNDVIGDVLLRVKNFTRKGEFQNISFEVHAGEVVSFAGLVGAGRTETMMSLFGDRKIKSGEVEINGKKTVISCPMVAVHNKMSLIPEDRKRHGLNLLGKVENNIEMVVEKKKCIGKIFINKKERKADAKKMIEELSIKCNGPDQKVISLSGGNQQKIVLAKWLLSDSDIFILDEPTRGIDIGAKIEIYKLINRLAREGKAIILISSELNEVIGLSNRVIVMYEGQITGELTGKDIEQEKIMSYAHSYDKEVEQ